jgi:hypothetical protein
LSIDVAIISSSNEITVKRRVEIRLAQRLVFEVICGDKLLAVGDLWLFVAW